MKKLILFCSICLLLSSCATVFGGRKNTVSVNLANPPEAKVYVNNKEIGQGVFKVRIPKTELQEGDSIVIKCEGYETTSMEIVRKANPWYVAIDFVATLGVGLLIDVATGNIYSPNTQNLKIELKKEGGSE